MEIQDRVYGNVVIEEPVLLKLIASKPVQRLKGINQNGITSKVIEKLTVTRYEHSLGVMIVLQKLGASVEEQIAGLLHDVPHTAFSHVIDWVFTSKQHDFHEKFHKKIILESEIPTILSEYGFDVNRILNEKNFPLLERAAPDLCADRVDYTLRDFLTTFPNSPHISQYIAHFTVHDNRIVIDNAEKAFNFAMDYLQIDEARWSNARDVACYQIMADALKVALENDIITEDDLFEDDKFVYNKLKQSDNKIILKKLEMLNPKLTINENPESYDFHSRSKLRYNDPEFLDSGKIKRVSEVYPEFRKKLEQHKARVERGNHIKIVSY